MNKQVNVNVNFDDLKDVICECGNLTFVEQYQIKKISALLSKSGKEEIMPYPVLACAKCGKLFDPQEESKKESTIITK